MTLDAISRRGCIAALSGLCLAAALLPAAAQTVEQFYKGRTVTLFVASAPGGINDLTARLIACATSRSRSTPRRRGTRWISPSNAGCS